MSKQARSSKGDAFICYRRLQPTLNWKDSGTTRCVKDYANGGSEKDESTIELSKPAGIAKGSSAEWYVKYGRHIHLLHVLMPATNAELERFRLEQLVYQYQAGRYELILSTLKAAMASIKSQHLLGETQVERIETWSALTLWEDDHCMCCLHEQAVTQIR